MHPSSFPGRGRALLATALVAGTLDITTALVKYALTTGHSPLVVLRYVASGLLGPAALAGGWAPAATGLVLHYVIAFAFTACFFWLYLRLRLQRYATPLLGLVYGALVWAVMNLLVVPASRVRHGPLQWQKAAVELLILVVCIGLPVAIGASRFYRRPPSSPQARLSR